ncbi:MAG: hypothetical protein R6V54_10400 [Desulfobacteraceae bacterium]
MDPFASKTKQWIDEGRDPRSAHWQAGLETVMNRFSQLLEPGCLVPVQPLEEKDVPVFNEAMERIDLSPDLLAAFLPPGVANAIVPPDAAKELLRIDPAKPSYKLLILRPGKEERILSGEFSPDADRPGLDIFQSGALLGNFDYESREIFLSEVSKTVHTHLWTRENWQEKERRAYTINWFQRCLLLGRQAVIMDRDNSFFHSPTVIKSNRIDALFLLIYQAVSSRLQGEKTPQNPAADAYDPDTGDNAEGSVTAFVQDQMLELLHRVKTLEIIDFTTFTNRENQAFKDEFARTLARLTADL